MSEINITLNSDIIKDGSCEIDLNKMKLISVPQKRHYDCVDLCFTEDGPSMNFAFIEKKGGLISYDDLSILFEEIAKRWNAYEEVTDGNY